MVEVVYPTRDAQRWPWFVWLHPTERPVNILCSVGWNGRYFTWLCLYSLHSLDTNHLYWDIRWPGSPLVCCGQEVGNGTPASGTVSYGLSESERFFFGSTTTTSQAIDNIRVWDKALNAAEISASLNPINQSVLANRNSAITVTSAGANTIGGSGAEGNLVAGHYMGIAVTSSTVSPCKGILLEPTKQTVLL